MSRPTRATAAGQAYLDLQNRARREHRTTSELLTLYVVERWQARLSLESWLSKTLETSPELAENGPDRRLRRSSSEVSGERTAQRCRVTSGRRLVGAVCTFADELVRIGSSATTWSAGRRMWLRG